MSEPDEPAGPSPADSDDTAGADGVDSDAPAPAVKAAAVKEAVAEVVAKVETAKPEVEPGAKKAAAKKAADHHGEAEKAAEALAIIAPPPMPPIVAFLTKIDRVLGNVEEGLLVLLVAILVFSAAFQAFEFRFLNKTPEWSNEVIRFSVFFIAFTGAALAAHNRKLLAMDVFTRFLSPRKRAFARVVTALFTIGICVALAWGGMAVRDSVMGEEGVVMDPEHAVLAIPIGAGVMALHMLIHLVIDSVYLASGTAPPEEETMPMH